MGMYEKGKKQIQKVSDKINAKLSNISEKTPFEAALSQHVVRWEAEVEKIAKKDRLKSQEARANDKIVAIQGIINATKEYLADPKRAEGSGPLKTLRGELAGAKDVLTDGVSKSHLDLMDALLKERKNLTDTMTKSLGSFSEKAGKLDKVVDTKVMSKEEERIRTAKSQVFKTLDENIKKEKVDSVAGVTNIEKHLQAAKEELGKLSKGAGWNPLAHKSVGLVDEAIQAVQREKLGHPVTAKVQEEAQKEAKADIVAEQKEDTTKTQERRPSMGGHGEE